MATRGSSEAPKKRGRPATTPEEREKQLQNMAYDLAEKQLASGNASSQIISMLIKGGGVREQLEMERLRNENRLLNARIDSMQAAARLEEHLEEAVKAFKAYNGDFQETDEDD